MVKNPEKINIIENFIKQYLNDLGPLNILSSDQEQELIDKYRAGDNDALQELVIKSQYIVIKEVLKFVGKGVELLDLLQNANLACILAVKQYTPNKGGFKNYLHRNIFRQLENKTPDLYSIIRYPLNILRNVVMLQMELEYFPFFLVGCCF
jgi:RNA polymerase primary sigma factor